MAEVVKTRFKQLSKTSTEWTSLNPTLLEGEIGFEKDTNKLKIGDGVSNWNTLEYTIGDNSSEIDTSNFVDLTSEQTITGQKTFTNNSSKSPIFIRYSSKEGIEFNSNTIKIGKGTSTPNSSGDIMYGRNLKVSAGSTSIVGNLLIGAGVEIDSVSGNTAVGNIAIGFSSNPTSIITDDMSKCVGSRNITIGYQAQIGDRFTNNVEDSIQLGTGKNDNSKTLQVYDYQLLDGNTGLIPNERLNLGTKKYLHRITLNLSDQVSGTAPTKMAVIHLDYYSEQETAYTNPNFATIALTSSIGCSGYYTDTDTSLTEKNFVYEIALPQSNEFVLNSSFSITIQSTGSSITDEVVGYIFS